MAFQFPPTPLPGQIFTPVAGVSYQWNGVAWYPVAGPSAFITAGQADLRYRGITTAAPKNIIIGGDFTTNPFQRGPAFTPIPATPTYIADRFAFIWNHLTATPVAQSLQSGDVPTLAQAGFLVQNSLGIISNNIQTAFSDSQISIQYTVEGRDFTALAQKPMTLSFWHKHKKVGAYSVAFRNGGADRHYVTTYQQAVSETWEKTVINIPASPAAGAWSYGSGSGLIVNFALMSGSGYFAPVLNTWGTGNFFTASTQVNGFDAINNNFRFALIQLERGDFATEFECRSQIQELQMCQRYFEKSYPQGYNPGTAGYMGPASGATQNGVPNLSALANVRYCVEKRIDPTVTIYDPATGTVGRLSDGATSNVSAADVVAFSATGCTIRATGVVGANMQIYAHWTAHADF